MLSLIRMSPLGRVARRLRWSFAGPVAPNALTGRVTVMSAPPVMETGRPSPWVVRVENHSRAIWHRTGPQVAEVSGRWIARTGEPHGDPVTAPLPRNLLPGDWADLSVAVPGPAAVGDFTLAWTLTLGGAPTELAAEPLPVAVTFPRSTDIDYHRVYQTADLAQNSWWVVGAYHSHEEFAKSAAARRQMLVDQGLTPDSRVLDIGCGTGQMAMALQDYLTDRGAYYGTDIGREGIEFCKRTYRRPNFVFAPGEMTRVPFADRDGPFDLAIFFSVFTHTFVDESVLLLAEAKRLLGPKGAIVADVIASELVGRGAGHRGQVLVNRDHFLRLAAALGLRGEVLGTVPWAPDATRLMIRFTRA